MCRIVAQFARAELSIETEQIKNGHRTARSSTSSFIIPMQPDTVNTQRDDIDDFTSEESSRMEFDDVLPVASRAIASPRQILEGIKFESEHVKKVDYKDGEPESEQNYRDGWVLHSDPGPSVEHNEKLHSYGTSVSNEMNVDDSASDVSADSDFDLLEEGEITNEEQPSDNDKPQTQRLLEFLQLHYPDSPSPDYTYNCNPGLNLYRGTLNILGIKQTFESSRYFSSEAEASEDVARLACQFLFAYRIAADNTGKLEGTLSSLFTSPAETTQPPKIESEPNIGLNSTDYVKPLTEWAKSQGLILEYEFLDHEAEGGHRARIFLNGTEFLSSISHKRKNDARIDVCRVSVLNFLYFVFFILILTFFFQVACEYYGIKGMPAKPASSQVKNGVVILQEYLQRMKLPKPEWKAYERTFNNKPMHFAEIVHLGTSYYGTQWFTTKAAAKNEVAEIAFNWIKNGIEPQSLDPEILRVINTPSVPKKKATKMNLNPLIPMNPPFHPLMHSPFFRPLPHPMNVPMVYPMNQIPMNPPINPVNPSINPINSLNPINRFQPNGSNLRPIMRGSGR
ncbi:hypothetical protein HK098_005372 [Nowakowskiella sp. JEL0407]|nr:hypothetical protein HK098_005372 [Nowakowskiella sp. JEL0407]